MKKVGKRKISTKDWEKEVNLNKRKKKVKTREKKVKQQQRKNQKKKKVRKAQKRCKVQIVSKNKVQKNSDSRLTRQWREKKVRLICPKVSEAALNNASDVSQQPKKKKKKKYNSGKIDLLQKL